jgi:hypothetical protein
MTRRDRTSSQALTSTDEEEPSKLSLREREKQKKFTLIPKEPKLKNGNEL